MNDSILLLAQNAKITNWFTPFWLLSCGAACGLILVLLFLGKVYILSRIKGINSIAENRFIYVLLSLLTSAGLAALGILYLGATYRWESMKEASSVNPAESGTMLAVVLMVGLALILGFGFWRLISSRRVDEVFSLVGEGFLGWFMILLTSLAGFAVIGMFLGMFNGFGLINFVEDPRGILRSVSRLPVSGNYMQELTLEPVSADSPGQLIELKSVSGNTPAIYGDEFQVLGVTTNQELHVGFEKLSIDLPRDRYFAIRPTADNTPVLLPVSQLNPPREAGEMYFANRGSNPAQVQMVFSLTPKYPEASLVVWSGLFAFLVVVTYLSLSVLAPKISAISLSTFKTEVSQPIFMVAFALTVVFIMFSIWLPYNTLGEDIKMYKDSGLTMIRVVGIFVAIWAASKSVAEEIEGRTALTVLSKPVGRRQFILGKISGISLAMGILFILLGIWFFLWVAYKPIYDSRESALASVEWPTCFVEATHIVPALLLAYMEVVIFVTISVAISTRMGILANLMICFAIYVLGHLTPLIVMSNELGGAFATVAFFGNFVSIVFPVLNHFDVQTAINTNSPVPWIYLGWAFVYTILYGTVAILLSLVFFEDRDLA